MLLFGLLAATAVSVYGLTLVALLMEELITEQPQRSQVIRHGSPYSIIHQTQPSAPPASTVELSTIVDQQYPPYETYPSEVSPKPIVSLQELWDHYQLEGEYSQLIHQFSVLGAPAWRSRIQSRLWQVYQACKQEQVSLSEALDKRLSNRSSNWDKQHFALIEDSVTHLLSVMVYEKNHS